ncbi:hypothetical protein LINPERPRIM_LOCUS17231 [Linum perenne]
MEKGNDLDHQHVAFVTRFQDMHRWDWEIKIHHIYKEGNPLAGQYCQSMPGYVVWTSLYPARRPRPNQMGNVC